MPRLTVRERLAPEITASLFASYRSSADALPALIGDADGGGMVVLLALGMRGRRHWERRPPQPPPRPGV